MGRLCWTTTFLIGMLAVGACSDAEPAASEAYCAVAVDAANGRINFTDDEQHAAIVDDPGLPERYRADMTAVAKKACKSWASASAWSNVDMVAVVNAMCGTKLTPVTAIP